MLTGLILALGAASSLACGEDGGRPGPEAEAVDEATAALTIEGFIETPNGPLAGAYVLALDESGRRIGVARTAASGWYALPLAASPHSLEVKSYLHVPRTYRRPALVSVGNQRARFDAHVGPVLGADATGENLTFMVLRSGTEVRVVPQTAWGNGGALASPLEQVADLLVGPRYAPLTTLIAADVRVPMVEDSVRFHGDHLEVQLSRELNQHSLGSAYLAGMIDQIVATVSHGYSEDGLPVRISVACAACPGGFEPLRDGVVGATGPGGSYEVQLPHPYDAFTDIYRHRFAHHLAMAKALGIATGYADGSDRPDRAVTRAELAAMLIKALGLSTINPATPSYSDVPRTYWAYRSIETARIHGLIAGSSDGRFRPTAGLTRAELASFLVNAARWPLATPAWSTFRDVPSTYWAHRKIETAHGWCRAVDVASYQDFGRFEPARLATRAEAIAGAVRMMQCLVGNEPRPTAG
ncbi:MAG: S-layer homology domain-containing protein [Deltaproteobacteria bacterium]|nr:S-layer homology domain-containing protein [Deltaproteobacteria bacterium]